MRRGEDKAEKFETDVRRLFSRLTWRLAQWASVPPQYTHPPQRFYASAAHR
jgi:hypothetical protein